MEIEHQNFQKHLFKGIVDQCDPSVQLSFLQFLQTQIILNIALVAKKYKKQEYFYKLAIVLVYFRGYLNRVDRSMYYLFYEEEKFATLEQTFIINIAKKTDTHFFQLRNSYEQLLQKFQEQCQCVQNKQQLSSILQTIFFQTDYPLPVCKRQTIGVYCQTPLQQFMSIIRFPTIGTPEQYMQESLIQMRKYFLQQNDMGKIVQNIQQKYQENLQKMSILRYCPYDIRNMNWNQLQIQNFEAHNLIVILFGLVSVNAKSSYAVIKEHEDPIMRMAQFVTRANIFKNIVLAVEEKFGFLFQSYGDIYEIITKGQHCQNIPKFQFWNGALAIWVQQFQELQHQLYKSFNYIVLKQRQANIMDYLEEKSDSLPSLYNPVKLQLQSKSIFQEKRNQIYQSTGISYEDFFNENTDNYEILAKDFLQHQVDVSINQFSVHKCGHSQHVIKRIPFFNNFLEKFKQSTNEFYQFLQKIIFKKNSDKKLRLSLLKDLIKLDLDFIDNKFTKPVILKEILISAQNLMKSLVQKLPQFAVFTEEACQKFKIDLDFNHQDSLLDYFCAKSQTPNDCQVQLRCFYDIYKDKTLKETLLLAASKNQEYISSFIQEEFYESSMSNNSVVSIQEE